MTGKKKKLDLFWSFQSSISGVILLSAITALLLSLFINLIHLVSSLNTNLPPHPDIPFRDKLSPEFFFIRFIIDGFLFTFLAGFILFFINLLPDKNYHLWGKHYRISFSERLIFSILFVVIFQLAHLLFFEFYLSPEFPRRGFNGMLITKNLTLLIIALLFGELLRLLFQQQRTRLEIEKIKKENIQTQYNAIAAQINPHFFFNSLNSLSALVREEKKDSSLKYIDRLSEIFRYILQSSQKCLVPLKEEINFLNAYRFLLGIRFEGKLFFDINVDQQYENHLLPVLSLQPLIENAIKHNVVSGANPFTIIITTTHNYLVLSNIIKPKLDKDQTGEGFGLSNLANRVMLLMGKELIISADENHFVVKVPLIKP